MRLPRRCAPHLAHASFKPVPRDRKGETRGYPILPPYRRTRIVCRSCARSRGGYIQGQDASCGSRACRRHRLFRPRMRRVGRGARRDMLQYLARRLSRDHHRPILCRADRCAHLSSDRELRRRARRCAGRASCLARTRRRRPVRRTLELAKRSVLGRISAHRRGHRRRRHRYARARAPHPLDRRPGGRHLDDGSRS